MQIASGADSASSSSVSGARSKENLAALSNCVRGMLANKGTVMTLERIHNMLTMICNASATSGSSGVASRNDVMKFDMNYIELKSFLEGLVANEVIDCLDGLYSGFVYKK